MTIQMMKWQLEEWIRDYKFMLREIERLNRLLNASVCGGGQKLTASYGNEMVMPKGSGGISQAEIRQHEERENRMKSYEEITEMLQEAYSHLYSEKFRVVYDCMLEGMSYRSIARHLGVSRDTIHNIKDNILEIIVQKGQEVHSLQLLKIDKEYIVNWKAGRGVEPLATATN
ncbi:helix-turn-helix domain-containing protein [Bacillus sp. JJ722]|uniref:helix-turn-helix domain-containing protein n=1 Tax=Bacillus sp. JJ722 TaxID=3122973 RepID=UPI002FFFF4A8